MAAIWSLDISPIPLLIQAIFYVIPSFDWTRESTRVAMVSTSVEVSLFSRYLASWFSTLKLSIFILLSLDFCSLNFWSKTLKHWEWYSNFSFSCSSSKIFALASDKRSLSDSAALMAKCQSRWTHLWIFQFGVCCLLQTQQLGIKQHYWPFSN